MSELTPPLNAGDHLLGDRSAPVQLVEYGDYECPFCGEAHPVVKALERALADQLCFAFRHFPIRGSHPHALVAAEAGEAASAQGKFWPMHDLLYQNQQALEVPDFTHYAAILGLDVDRFEQDLRSHRFAGKVREDFRSGALSGVNGTPSFFINGYRHDGPFDFDSLWMTITGSPYSGAYEGE